MHTVRTRRSENRRIRNRRTVVSVNGTRERCPERRKQQSRCHVRLTDHRDDRDQHAERAPGSTHGKTHESRDHKNQDRKQRHRQIRCADKARNKDARSDQLAAHTAQTPGKNQDQHRRNDTSDTVYDTLNEFLRSHQSARNIQHKSRDKSRKCSQRQPRRRIISDCLRKTDALKEPANVSHTAYSADDQHNNRQDQINDLPFGLRSVSFRLFLRSFLEHPLLRCLHRPEILPAKTYEKHHDDCQKRIEIVGNDFKENVKTIRLTHLTGYRDSPAGHRCNDTHRSCRRIDNISQLLPGNAKSVSNRPHDRTDCEAVEAIINKYQDAKQGCEKRRRASALQSLFGPPSVGSAAARLIYKHDYSPEKSQKDNHI